MRGTIICGVSETPDGRVAAELARALGARLGLRLVLVHVIDGVPPGAEESLSARRRLSVAERKSVLRQLESKWSRCSLRERYPDVRFEVLDAHILAV